MNALWEAERDAKRETRFAFVYVCFIVTILRGSHIASWINSNLVRAWSLAKLQAIRIRRVSLSLHVASSRRNATSARMGSDVNQTRIAVKRGFTRDDVASQGNGKSEIKLRLRSCVNGFVASSCLSCSSLDDSLSSRRWIVQELLNTL